MFEGIQTSGYGDKYPVQLNPVCVCTFDVHVELHEVLKFIKIRLIRLKFVALKKCKKPYFSAHHAKSNCLIHSANF